MASKDASIPDNVKVMHPKKAGCNFAKCFRHKLEDVKLRLRKMTKLICLLSVSTWPNEVSRFFPATVQGIRNH
jgi:hypothetical protein